MALGGSVLACAGVGEVMVENLPTWDDDDVALATSILGTADRDQAVAQLAAWVAAQGYDNPEVISLELSVGAAAAIRLGDGSWMFMKAWSAEADRSALAAQCAVQQAMADRGFPAPRLLSPLLPLGDGCAVIMAFDQGGTPTDVRIPGVSEAMARGLARLIKTGRDLVETPGLPERIVPSGLWPKPHNVLFDFEKTTPGAEWIDEVARDALTVLRASSAPRVLSHMDWSAKNMRMGSDEIAVVYDWDSVYLETEASVVGSAAATFPTTWDLPVDPIPTRDQVLTFLAAYDVERGEPLAEKELVEVLAVFNYTQAYVARCGHALDPEAAKRRWADKLGRMSL